MRDYIYYDAYHRKRRMPGFSIGPWIKGKRGVFFVSFIICIIAGRVFLWNEICEFQTWNITCIGKLNVHTIDTKSLFCYLLLHRGELLLFVILASITKLKKILYYVISSAAGAILGFLQLSFWHSFGIKGIFVLGITLMPHWIVYGILFTFLYWVFVDRKNLNFTGGWMVLYAICIGILFLVGIYLECFVNPLLMSWTRELLLS